VARADAALYEAKRQGRNRAILGVDADPADATDGADARETNGADARETNERGNPLE
jgi:hypothetical protein